MLDCSTSARSLSASSIGFAAHHAGDVGAALLKEFGGGRISSNRANVEDEVILGKPLRIGTNEGCLSTRGLRTSETFCLTLKIGAGHPLGGQGDQVFPLTGEWDFKDHADNAVVVILNLPVEGQIAVNPRWLQLFDDRRPRESNILRC